MHRWVTDIILLSMCGVWVYLSVLHGKFESISADFIGLGLTLAGVKGSEFLATKYREAFYGKLTGGQPGSSNSRDLQDTVSRYSS